MSTTTSVVDELLAAATQMISARHPFPGTTYRLQFHAGFTFNDATKIIPYLRDLGVTHVYASPLLKARAGSTHGYDVIDHHALNPELGTAEDFHAYTQALREHGMRQVLDIVPNHMGIATNDNALWNDVLENGPGSRYAGWFDIAWRGSPRPQLHDKVLLPILGEIYGNVLEKGQLVVKFERGELAVHYFERALPLSPRSIRQLLQIDPVRDEPARQEINALLDAPDAEIKDRLRSASQRHPGFQDSIAKKVNAINGVAGNARSFDRLDKLLGEQFYRLAYWRVASDEINYRRFFDINDLAALCMERPEAFEFAHEFIFALLKDGHISGLRVDHPDGIYDPRDYFRRLQHRYLVSAARDVYQSDERYRREAWEEVEKAISARLLEPDLTEGSEPARWPLYVVAEKILAADEPLPDDWAVHGTSGYDFIARINSLFIDPAGALAFSQRYADWIRDTDSFEEIVYQKKRLILQHSLASELQMLAHQLDRLAQRERHWRDFTLRALREGLREVIACFPVYRSYISDEIIHDSDRRCVESAIRAVIERNPTIDASLFHFLRDILLLHYPRTFTEADRAAQRRFVGKFQQVTAPATAKGVEDTAFYVYTRLISLNEVGGDPARFGANPTAVHRWLADRQRHWPYALSPLSTHDTKRSEDVRARLNVLSEIPDEWWQRIARWSRLNEPLRRSADGKTSPDPNEEYLLYQTLVGAWPLDAKTSDPGDAFIARIQEYMVKAMREAKVNTSWSRQNKEYEQAAADFIASILRGESAPLFLQDFRGFQRRITHYGLLNSMSQTLLRLAAPGAPDTYQGTELWDFSLVDPDNRRPVDYGRRRHLLDSLRASIAAAGADRSAYARELIDAREDGRVKLYVTQAIHQCRQENPELFTTGEYLPVEITGSRRNHLFSFMRRQGDRWALVLVPRFLSHLAPAGELPLGEAVWLDVRLILPPHAGAVAFVDRFTGEKIVPQEEEAGRLSVRVAQVLRHFPVALLIS